MKVEMQPAAARAGAPSAGASGPRLKGLPRARVRRALARQANQASGQRQFPLPCLKATPTLYQQLTGCPFFFAGENVH